MTTLNDFQRIDQQKRVNSGIAHNIRTEDVLKEIFSNCTAKVEVINAQKISKQKRIKPLNVNPQDNSSYGSEQILNYCKRGLDKFSRTSYKILKLDQIVLYINEEEKIIVFFSIDNTKSDHGRIKEKFSDAVMLKKHFDKIWELNFQNIFPHLDGYKYLIISIVNFPAHFTPDEYQNLKKETETNVAQIREHLNNVSKYNEGDWGLDFATDTDGLQYLLTRCYNEKICDKEEMRRILFEYYTHPIYYTLPMISLASICSKKHRKIITWYLDNKPKNISKQELIDLIKEYNMKYSAGIKTNGNKKKLIEKVNEIITELGSGNNAFE